MQFPPQLEMRPSYFAPTPVEFWESHPNSTVYLTSHRRHEKLCGVTETGQGNPGFPAAIRERPRGSTINASLGPIPLP